MFDIRDHGGALGGGGLRKGSILNINDLENVSLVMNTKKTFSSSVIFHMDNLSNKRIMMAYYEGSTPYLCCYDDGVLVLDYLRYPSSTIRVIPLSDGRFVVQINRYDIDIYDANFVKVSGSARLRIQSAEGSIIAYEFEGRLMIIGSDLGFSRVNLSTWTVEAYGMIPGGTHTTGYEVMPGSYDVDNEYIYIKTGGLNGPIVKVNKNLNPAITHLVNTFYGKSATLNNDSTEFFVFNSTTDMIEVYNTVTGVKLRSFRAFYLNQNYVTDYNGIRFFKYLENQNLILISAGGYTNLLSPIDGSIVQVIHQNPQDFLPDVWGPQNRMIRGDKQDTFYVNNQSNQTSKLQIVSTTVKIK